MKIKKYKVVPKKYRFIFYYLFYRVLLEDIHIKIRLNIKGKVIQQDLWRVLGFCSTFNYIARAYNINSYSNRRGAYKEIYDTAGDKAEQLEYGVFLRLDLLEKVLGDNKEYMIKNKIIEKANSCII